MTQFIHEEHHRGGIIDPRHVPGSLCSHPLPYAVTQAMCHVPGTLCGSRCTPYHPVGQRHENTTRVHNTRQITSVGAAIIMLPLQDVGDETVMLQVIANNNLDEKME